VQTTRFLQEGLETGSTALAFSSHSLMFQLSKNPHPALRNPGLKLRCARTWA